MSEANHNPDGSADDERQHAESCEGHIDCPDCGKDSCAKIVIWSVEDGDESPEVVVCLSCFQRFAVD